jgi:hypothetical protein
MHRRGLSQIGRAVCHWDTISALHPVGPGGVHFPAEPRVGDVDAKGALLVLTDQVDDVLRDRRRGGKRKGENHCESKICTYDGCPSYKTSTLVLGEEHARHRLDEDDDVGEEVSAEVKPKVDFAEVQYLSCLALRYGHSLSLSVYSPY